MKNILILFLLLLDLFVFTMLLINSNLIYLLLYTFINILLLVVFTKRYLNISIININRLINLINNYYLRKKISVSEKYLEPITINTFDGSNGTTHPYVMKFDKLYNKYKYYMVHTPYDNHNVDFENPSLCISNDGMNFSYNNNIKNPLLPVKNNIDSKILSYYNDNFLFYENDELQVWYRYTAENKNTNPAKLKNQIYRIVSKDGIDFKEPELMIEDDSWYLSPSIVKISDLYYLYYFDKDYKMYCKTSKNLYDWSKPIFVKNHNFNGNYWHGEVKLINNKLYLLFLSKTFELYWCETCFDKPYEFETCNKLKLYYYDKCHIYGAAHPYKSSFILEDKNIILYIPFVVNKLNLFKPNGIKHDKWTMTYTKLSMDNFNKYIINSNK